MSRGGGEQNRKGKLLSAAEIRGELAERRGLQWKDLNKRKDWPQCHKVSSWQGRQSLLCQKEKEQSHLSII